MNKNILIGALVVIIAILGFTILKPKNSLAPATIPNGQTTTINNPDGKDYQPLSTNCTSSNPPSITVLSPNGGEVYQAGKKITVNWESCNLAKTTPIQILLQANFTGGAWNTSPGSTFDLGSTGYGEGKLLNSGSATLVLPTQGSTQWTGYSKTMKYGNYYKVYVSQNLADYIDASDMSDNSFTINDSSISTVLPKYIGDQEGWPPVIKTSGSHYSCTPEQSEVSYTAERTINNRTFCVTDHHEGAAGSTYHTFTYKTFGIQGSSESTTFTLKYQSCGVWKGDATTEEYECRTAQSTFNSNLDSLISDLFLNFKDLN